MSDMLQLVGRVAKAARCLVAMFDVTSFWSILLWYLTDKLKHVGHLVELFREA